MRILLAAMTVYFPSFGGAGKANRAIAEQLAGRGHLVRAIGPALSQAGFTSIEGFRQALERAGIVPQIDDGVDVFERGGVRVYAPAGMHRLFEAYKKQLVDFAPDCVLLTSEDLQMGLLEIALEKESPAVALLVHGAISLPFGPVAMRPNGWGEKLMRRADAIIAPGRFMRDYIHTHSGLDATIIHLPAYPLLPYHSPARFDNPFVTILNPSAGKGIDIFLEMVRRLPDVQFAAVPTWSTTAMEHKMLREHANVTILNKTGDVEEIWSQTRIALMPSTWPEAFPLTPVEAMLHGIPVLASNAGGTSEAMLGADFVLPVQQMTGYAPTGNPFLPAPVIPAQRPEDMRQWELALRLLTGNRSAYESHSAAAQQAAAQFASSLSVEPFEHLFEQIVRRKHSFVAPLRQPGRPTQDIAGKIAQLTPEQRAVLQGWLHTEKGKTEPPASRQSPETDTEIAIAGIFSDYLGTDAIDIHDNLFELNGHPLIAAEVIQQLRRTLAPDLPLHALFERPTIAGLAAHIRAKTAGPTPGEASFRRSGQSLRPSASMNRHLLPLRMAGPRPPLFFVPGGGGSETEYMTAYAGLVNALGPAQPIYGFQAQTRDGLELPFQTVEEMAWTFVAEMTGVQSHGPYFILAECVGAKTALEMARRLAAQGEPIGLLLFLNGLTGAPIPGPGAPHRGQSTISNRVQKLRTVPPGQRLARLKLMARNTATTLLPLTDDQRMSHARRATRMGTIALLSRYEPQAYIGDLIVLMTPDIQARGEPAAWAGLVQGKLTLKTLTGVHRNYLGEHLAANAAVVAETLATAYASAMRA